jgi:hypothetical protein
MWLANNIDNISNLQSTILCDYYCSFNHCRSILNFYTRSKLFKTYFCGIPFYKRKNLQLFVFSENLLISIYKFYNDQMCLLELNRTQIERGGQSLKYVYYY